MLVCKWERPARSVVNRFWKVLLFLSIAYGVQPSACRQKTIDYCVRLSTFCSDDGAMR